MGWLFFLGVMAAMLWQLPRVRKGRQGKTVVIWLVLWMVVIALGTAYFYGGSWLAQWRLV